MNQKVINTGLILVVILLIIKSNFVILIPRGDTTIFLGLKLNPFKENIVYQYEKEKDGVFTILYSDENQLIGENLYRMIFAPHLIIYVLLLSLFLILCIRTNQIKNNI